MKKILILSLACIVGIVSGCEKEDMDASSSCAISKEKIVGTYRITKVEAKAPGTSIYLNVTNSTFANMEPCEIDNSIILKADGAILYEDTGIKCDPPQTYVQNTWSLNGNNITIEALEGTIESFDCKALVVIHENADGTNITVRLTYTKNK